MNLGIFSPEQIRSIVVNFKNLPKNVVLLKSKLVDYTGKVLLI